MTSTRTPSTQMVAAINSLSDASFPYDGGLGSADPSAEWISSLKAATSPTARSSWNKGQFNRRLSPAQFTQDYVNGLSLQNQAGRRAELYVVPGNHDASNAVGFHRVMTPAVDPSAMVGIYNLMMRPTKPKTVETFRYATDRVNYSRDIGGIHLVFLSVWADSHERAWVTRDLLHVPVTTPVIVFMHDQPDAEAKHFINPNGQHDLNRSTGSRISSATPFRTVR